eukprot:scaffold24732_cov122-Isochrysis_galbana.AAC.1
MTVIRPGYIFRTLLHLVAAEHFYRNAMPGHTTRHKAPLVSIWKTKSMIAQIDDTGEDIDASENM